MTFTKVFLASFKTSLGYVEDVAQFSKYFNFVRVVSHHYTDERLGEADGTLCICSKIY